MNVDYQIRYLQQKEIDKKKWDACITNASNGLIYAYSFYLDQMTKNWDALVMNDYETVMPLTWNKKYGFYYLYQPAFIAQLGVFGNHLNEELVQKFLEHIPAKFKLKEISLNDQNNFPSVINGYYPRINHVLDLNKPYEELVKNYRDNHKRNISKAIQLGCIVTKETPVDEVIELHEELLRNIDGTKPEDYINFKNLFEQLKSKGQAKTYAIVQKNKVLASAVFFLSHNRTYYILVGNHPDGKTLGASHALIDAFIKDHAGQNLILDFEGSDIRNLAFFYSGFGAKEETYPGIKINNLPWYIKLFKK